MIKKVLLTLLIAFTLLVNISNINAAEKTLGQLKSELQNYKNKKAATTEKKNKTEEEIKNQKNDITNKQIEVSNNQKKIDNTKEEIKKLNSQIDDTKKKIKDVIIDEELNKADNNYLEYLFGAKTISDFIIRFSIGSQVTDYNDSLVNNYEETIKEQQKLQEDLNKKEQELQSQIVELNKSVAELGEDLEDIKDEESTYDNYMSGLEEQITKLNKNGCKDYQTLSQCINVKKTTVSKSTTSANVTSVAPSSPNGFMRPTTRGTITSNYGWRYHPTLGYSRLHAGIDIGVTEGTPVYATIAGTVGMIKTRQSCGGNQVFVYHNVNGKQITSVYMHLLSISVSSGQQVTNQTLIGYSGG